VSPVCPKGADPQGAEPDGLRDLLDVLDEQPFLPPAIVDLALWVAEYYLCAPGEALAAAMPPRAWVESERHVQITDEAARGGRGRAGVRRAILDALADGHRVGVDALAERFARAALG